MRSASTEQLPTLRTYDDAVRHYRSVAPIRGSDNLRPLSTNRRRKTQRIERRTQYFKGRQRDAIVCVLYDTAVLTFYDMGVYSEVVFCDGGYQTLTTCAFANKILGMHSQDNSIHFSRKTLNHKDKQVIVVESAKTRYNVAQRIAIPSNTRTEMQFDKHREYWRIKPPVQQWKTEVQHKMLKQKLDSVASFVTLARAIAKLTQLEDIAKLALDVYDQEQGIYCEDYRYSEGLAHLVEPMAKMAYHGTSTDLYNLMTGSNTEQVLATHCLLLAVTYRGHPAWKYRTHHEDDPRGALDQLIDNAVKCAWRREIFKQVKTDNFIKHDKQREFTGHDVHKPMHLQREFDFPSACSRFTMGNTYKRQSFNY